MTKKFAEVEVKTQPAIEGVDFTPSGKLAQANRGDSLAVPTSTEISHWQLAHEGAIEYWLTEYKSRTDASNLEKVRGYLEAFHHYCEVEDWEKASKILSTRLNTSNNAELGYKLHIWGYYLPLIELHNRLLDKLNPRYDRICYQEIGNAYFRLGDYTKAIQYQQQSLMIAQKISDRKGEGLALANLGLTYFRLGKHSKAIQYQQQSLMIAQKISDRNGEGSALTNLGYFYYCLKDYDSAIEYQQQSLTIFREIGDRNGEGSALTHLGNACCALKHYASAIEYQQQSLTIAREISTRNGEGLALVSLGSTYYCLKDYDSAIEYQQQSLTIFREIANPNGERIALENLALTYYCLRDGTSAFDRCNEAIAIATELGIPIAKECQELKEKLLSGE